jgi:hypothetical protein
MMKRIFAIPLMALALLVSYMASAHALPVGWSVVRPSYCLGYQSGGVDYLNIYNPDGSYVYTNDSVAVTSAVPFCASGYPFYVYTLDGFHVNYVMVVSGLR